MAREPTVGETIDDLQAVLRNGRRRPSQRSLDDAPLLRQMTSPDYTVVGFEWRAGGRTYARPCDAQAQSIVCTPDRTSLVALQDHRTHGPDNVVVLSPRGTLLRRIANPYPQLPDAHPQADCWFDEVRLADGRVVLHLMATWMQPAYDRPAMPGYEATYDPATWALLALQWRPMT